MWRLALPENSDLQSSKWDKFKGFHTKFFLTRIFPYKDKFVDGKLPVIENLNSDILHNIKKLGDSTEFVEHKFEHSKALVRTRSEYS